MNILILGTSNSILKGGYTDGLRKHPQIEKLDRFGPGGSTSIMLPYFSKNIDFSAYDYVIIDTALNDGAFMSWGKLTIDEVRDNIQWICSHALRSGCTPILLIMPNNSFIGKQDPGAEVYTKIAHKFKLRLLNGYDLVDQIAREEKQPISSLFLDDLHLRPEVSCLFVPKLIALLKPAGTKVNEFRPPEFRYIEASSLKLAQYKRETSLMKVNAACLEAKHQLKITLAPHEVLAGVVYNSAHSNGVLTVSGDTQTQVHLSSHYFRKHELVAAARQISPEIGAKDGVIHVILNQNNTDTAEIIAFIVKSPHSSQPTHSQRGHIVAIFE